MLLGAPAQIHVVTSTREKRAGAHPLPAPAPILPGTGPGDA